MSEIKINSNSIANKSTFVKDPSTDNSQDSQDNLAQNVGTKTINRAVGFNGEENVTTDSFNPIEIKDFKLSRLL